MLDSTSRNIIKILRKQEDGRADTRIVAKELGLSEADAWAAFSYLEGQGYVEIATPTVPVVKMDGTPVGSSISLKHRGRKIGEFRAMSVMAYIRDNWIAIIALLVSIVALVRTL